MVIRQSFLIIRTLRPNIRNYSQQTKIGERNWQILAAVCLERHPLISPPLPELHSRYKELISRIEFEQSLFSAHEVRKEQDKIQAQKLASGEIEALSEDEKQVQTAQDFEDMVKEERAQFRAAERLEKTSMDQKSLKRSYCEKLVLAVKQKLYESTDFEEGLNWSFPFAIHQDGETLRQTAERAANFNLNAKIIGNAPIGFHKFKYAKRAPVSSQYVGAKIFFYKAHISQENQSLEIDENQIIDYKWLLHKELPAHFDSEYHRSVSKFLMQ